MGYFNAVDDRGDRVRKTGLGTPDRECQHDTVENFDLTLSFSVRRMLSVYYSPGHYLFRISTELTFDPQVAQHTVKNRRCAFRTIHTSQILRDAASLNIVAGGRL
ncbi:hypothetical protein DAPPUDRAFT_258925 [Daphnia pulex]|uniref:Uncharacterized protein n=1 Tax=Daphnia pulex TaxID=6669 RepID=E9HGA2_DAPPU|nr:hypothetical protein DAPPUDRAFT_258925 [Daphnia pulex]|eukprot:EFX69235.1 hypothetical protein DAPPUDRAFT_258925 [Daphnia pulex]